MLHCCIQSYSEHQMRSCKEGTCFTSRQCCDAAAVAAANARQLLEKSAAFAAAAATATATATAASAAAAAAAAATAFAVFILPAQQHDAVIYRRSEAATGQWRRQVACACQRHADATGFQCARMLLCASVEVFVTAAAPGYQLE